MKIKVKVAEKQRRILEISTPVIRLDAAMKLSNAVSTGGQAKFVIQDGFVRVNGEVCTQRGKKLRTGDIFMFEHVVYEVRQCT